jgi:methyltransferase OMS1
MFQSMSVPRKIAITVTATGFYSTVAYATYLNYQKTVKDNAAMQALNETRGNDNTDFSYVNDPNRNQKFGELAACYDSEIGREETMMGLNWLRSRLLSHARGNTLEIGVGTGRNLPYYPNAVKRAVLTDVSSEMLKVTRDKIKQLAPERQHKFAILEVDAECLKDALQLPDNTFDTVIDTFGLCSYNDPVASLKQMARVCKPDGKILLLEHGRSKSYQFVSKHLDKNAERHACNWGCVWNRDIDAILEQCETEGFLKVESIWKWHFGTTYYCICRPL